MTAAAGGPRDQAVAIVGMAGRFPGAASLEQFWDNLARGVESIVTFSDRQLERAGGDPELLAHPRYVKAQPWLEGVELFDAELFGIGARDAELLDPQHRAFLECAWEALEHAGYGAAPDATGVFAGVARSGYLLHNLRALAAAPGGLDGLALQTATDKDHLATRVAYKLDLRGPAITVQTACSTGLVAVDLARQSLVGRGCDLALAGAVAIQIPHTTGYLYEEGGILSPDGHCRAFDAGAQGTLFGSGAGIVVLKRLADAIADGDSIHAVLLASATNNDGACKVGYTAPSADGQAAVIFRAQAAAGVTPDTVTYLEAHGTGTPLGDQIEIEALTQAFRAGGAAQRGFCAIGSVKSNIGHLETAAGMAGLIKTVLALEHRQLPPSLHCERPNPAIDFAASPFVVQTRLAPWPPGPAPRRAGVSSFGIGGTNAHVVLEEAPPAAPSAPGRGWQLLALSARTRPALERMTSRLSEHLQLRPDLPLADVAYTLGTGRRALPVRRMLISADGAAAAAEALAAGDPECLLSGRAAAGARPVIFLFPGQGAQHLRMGAELYREEAGFRSAFDGCAELFARHQAWDLRRLVAPDPDPGAEAALAQTACAQAALFTVELALAELYQAWGVRPAAMIGHSLGEFVAATLAGVLSLPAAVTLVAERGRLMAQLPPGAMLAVGLGEREVAPLLADGLALAAANGPRQSTVCGPQEQIVTLAAELRARGVECRQLATAHAFHGAAVEAIVPAFRQAVAALDLAPPRLPFVSGVTGAWITAAEATSPEHWVRHLRQTVRFGAGLDLLLGRPEHVLVEVGPGRSLAALARLHPRGGAERLVLPSLPAADAPESEMGTLLRTVGQLWLAGVTVDWHAFYSGQRRRRLPLPTYPFERQRYWIDPPRRAPELPAAPTHSQAAAPREEQPVRPAAAAATPEAAVAARVARGNGAGPARPDLGTAFVAPRDEVEGRVAAVWAAVLGLDRVGVRDNFFELGGQSLLAAQLTGRLGEVFGVELPLSRLAQAPTAAGLARVIADLCAAEMEQRRQEAVAQVMSLSEEEAAAEVERRLGSAGLAHGGGDERTTA